MKRVFIIHRWDGGPDDDWRPWLKKELQKLGYEVFVPAMPDTDVPVIGKWVSYLTEIVGKPDSDTYFIGHSIGCQTILRYLETVSESVGPPPARAGGAQAGGAIFIAGWFNMKNLEDEEVKEIAQPWIERPIDLKKVKKVLPKSTLIISDNDPYDAFEENKNKFTELGSKIVVVHNAGHFTESDGYTELPEILKEFKKL